MQSDQFILYAGCTIVAIAIFFYLTQWAHQIHKRNRLLEAQINLLAKIAEKHGVSINEVNEIVERVQMKHEPLS